MLTQHTFNESLKRLEPVDNTCGYCGKLNAQRMNDNYFVPLFKQQDRTNVVVYRSVQYKKILVGIPRCAHCLQIHESTSQKGLYSWLFAAALFAIAIPLFNLFALFAIIPCIVVGVLGSSIIEDRLVATSGILSKKEGAKKNQTVQELVISGWTLTQPTA